MTDRSMDKIIDHLPLSWLPLPTTQSALSDVAQIYVSKSLFDQEFKDSRYMPWKFNYLDYSQLQQCIDTISSSKVVGKRIELEWIKVHEFFTLKKGEIERRIAACHLLNKEDNHQLPEQVKIVQSDIYRLYHFAKLNYSGFLRLFMRYDQLFESSLTDLLLNRMLTNKTFWDPSTVLFELAYQTNCLIPSPSNLAPSIKKETIKKKTIKKYWVHPDNILEVMLYLSSQAVIQSNRPLDLYPAVSELGPLFPSETEDEKQGCVTNFDETSKTQITTIHFDTPTFTNYSDRIANKGSRDSMIRMRCFNDPSKGHEASNSVAIEEKIYGHGVSDADEQSQSYTHKSLGKVPQYVQEPIFSAVSEEQSNCSHIKQRLWLRKNQASSWVQENYSFQNLLSETSSHNCTKENKDQLKDICLQFERKICTRLKSPVLKTTQTRTVFQTYDTETTIYIDTDIVMMHQDATKDLFARSSSYPHLNLSSNDAVRFPYCLVQVIGKELPELHSCCLLEPVHDFSIYLHGVGTLFSDKVHVYPRWLQSPLDDDLRRLPFRGDLLFSGEKRQQQNSNQGSVVINANTGGSNSTQSSTIHTPWSSTTIATIVTCYDDVEDQDNQYVHPQDDNKLSVHPHHALSSTNSRRPSLEVIINSPLLSPSSRLSFDTTSPLLSPARRSFDSYCTFDHPTSSRSDPTNCRNCIERRYSFEPEGYFFNSTRQLLLHSPPEGKKKGFNSNKFLSSIDALCQNLKLHKHFSSNQNNQRLNYNTFHHDNLVTRKKGPTFLAISCLVISFAISYLFYVLLMVL